MGVMVRTPFRVMVAAWTMFALLATAVSPVVMHAMEGQLGGPNSHACCPEAFSESAPAGDSTDAPMACCAIGGARRHIPANGQTPTKVDASSSGVVRHASWEQPVGVATGLLPRSGLPLGQVSLLLRTSVLLI
jgi:hypothetical protein